MNSSGEIYAIILALLFAVAAGLVGSFALMKRMLLASDVISHVALPGIGLAFLFGFNPLLGGAACGSLSKDSQLKRVLTLCDYILAKWSLEHPEPG
jgi:ABC-type Mn2+/Zn2+ transport system permease subunit